VEGEKWHFDSFYPEYYTEQLKTGAIGFKGA
jgi:hypothetical protein